VEVREFTLSLLKKKKKKRYYLEKRVDEIKRKRNI